MPLPDEMARQRTASTAELQDQSSPMANRLEQGEDARRAGVGMERICEVMHARELAPVVRVRSDGRERYSRSLPHVPQTREVSQGNNERMSHDESGSPVFRSAGISYLRIPAPDPPLAAAFYEAVFGWTIRGGSREPSFEDGTGHVIGHFMTDQRVAGDAGIRPYIYVENLGSTIDKIMEHGGAIETAPYDEGDLRVATFRDPAGNVVGVWERA